MRVIPAIDLKAGRCVRLLRGDFDAVTDYSDDAIGIARDYAQLGARYMHIVDLDGARSGQSGNRAKIQELLETTQMKVQVGGGIRNREAIQQWLAAGVDRVVVGSAAITEPTQTANWLSEFGADKIVLALDVRLGDNGIPMVTTHGWTKTSNTPLNDAIENFNAAGLRHVLCTDVARDGAMSGPNTTLYQQLASVFPDLCIQASGGVSQASDLDALAATGVTDVISGKALLDKKISARELAPYLPDA